MNHVLLQLHIGLSLRCEAWENIPLPCTVQIVIYAHSALPGADGCARQGFDLLKRKLSLLGARRIPPPCTPGNLVDNYALPANLCAGVLPNQYKRVLIYIADGSAGIDPDIATYFSTPEAVIVPIVDRSLGLDPRKWLPPAFPTRLATFIDHYNMAPVIPLIGRAAGILTDSFRIFISYIHMDAATVAAQLFHALSEKMFDVFLDRFSSRTGDDFVTLIQEELADKACVLVLETAHIGESEYCRQEIATATQYSLGTLAIDLAGSMQVFQTVFTRLDLTHAGGHGAGLSSTELQTAVDFITANYDAEIARRFRDQDKLLHDSITAARLTPIAKGIGLYEVDNGLQRYLLAMSRRPPDVQEFIEAEQQATAPKPILFGPLAAVRTARAARIGWLGEKSGVMPVDEGHVQRTLDDIANHKI